jgi:hypothetical protein
MIGSQPSQQVTFGAAQAKKGSFLRNATLAAALSTAALGLPTAASAHGDHSQTGKPDQHVHVEAAGHDIPVYTWPLLGALGVGIAGGIALLRRKKAEKAEQA